MTKAKICKCSHMSGDHIERYDTKTDTHYRDECLFDTCDCKKFKFDHTATRGGRGPSIKLPDPIASGNYEKLNESMSKKKYKKLLKMGNLGLNGKPHESKL